MKRALLVEDHSDLRAVLTMGLENFGLEVEAAADGTVALQLLEKLRFDLVVSDLRLPGADGFVIVRTALKQQPPPAVLIISGFVSPEDESEIEVLGARLLRKPFRSSEFRSNIESLLAG